jgi:hypothetical protein
MVAKVPTCEAHSAIGGAIIARGMTLTEGLSRSVAGPTCRIFRRAQGMLWTVARPRPTRT